MKPFSSHRARRNASFVAVLLWVFAQASGMANACLLETPGRHPHDTASHLSDIHHVGAHDALAVDGDAVDHHDGSDSPKDSCLKACDDSSHGLVKLKSGADQTDPGHAPLVAFAWDAMKPGATASGWAGALRVPIVGPPFRLRYSRLTL